MIHDARKPPTSHAASVFAPCSRFPVAANATTRVMKNAARATDALAPLTRRATAWVTTATRAAPTPSTAIHSHAAAGAHEGITKAFVYPSAGADAKQVTTPEAIPMSDPLISPCMVLSLS